jgi:hypothetical protein
MVSRYRCGRLRPRPLHIVSLLAGELADADKGADTGEVDRRRQ